MPEDIMSDRLASYVPNKAKALLSPNLSDQSAAWANDLQFTIASLQSRVFFMSRVPGFSFSLDF